MADRDEHEAILADLAAADASLAAALDARASAVQRLVTLRHRDPEGFFRGPLDEAVLRRIRDALRVFPPKDVEPIVRELLGVSAALAAPRRIAFFGADAGFAHLAARRTFGETATYEARDSVQALLDEVRGERVSRAVLPLETSTDGVVSATLHGLTAVEEVRICGEVTVATSYHLYSPSGNAANVGKIYGAIPALGACEQYLRRDHARATVLDVPSGAMAAELARDDQGAAVLGTELLGALYGLTRIAERVEDQAEARTRYAIVGRDLVPRTGRDRTIVSLALRDEPGALYQSLAPFADRDVNLTRLESRPASRGPWRYVFYLEMDGHVSDRNVVTALEDVRATSRHVRVLGSYPRPTER
ncbi:MAG: prephenate dehydratase domain-containing protein [Myxococcota bacterium]